MTTQIDRDFVRIDEGQVHYRAVGDVTFGIGRPPRPAAQCSAGEGLGDGLLSLALGPAVVRPVRRAAARATAARGDSRKDCLSPRRVAARQDMIAASSARAATATPAPPPAAARGPSHFGAASLPHTHTNI